MKSTAYAATILLKAALFAGACFFPHPLSAQQPSGLNGVLLARLSAKNPEGLAKKAGGATERIEIQSTDDHIDYVVKSYVLKEANASEVYELIQQAIALEGGKVSRIADGSSVEVGKDGATCATRYCGNSILVVTAPDWMIPYLDETIKTLDRKDLKASAFGTGGIYARVKHRLPSKVAALIRETVASSNAVLKPDDTRQILYLEDTPSYFGADLEALRTFDAPPPQIETRVRIYEVNEEQGRDVGLDWQAWKNAMHDGQLNIDWNNANHSGSCQMDLRSLSAELSFAPELAAEFLNYLVSRGHARVITDSRLTQTNNQQAVVRSVTQLPYVVRGMDRGDAGNAHGQDSPAAQDADRQIKEFTEGVVVEMTPRIGSEIELAVRATVASHIGYTPNQSVPLITDSSVNTVVLLIPGKAAVLGGLSRQTRTSERAGVAGLKDLPGLKNIFSREVERIHRSQIILTIALDRIAPGREQVLEAAEALPPPITKKP